MACQFSADDLQSLFQAGEQIMARLEHTEPCFEIPRPKQSPVVCRIGETDKDRRKPSIGKHKASLMVLAVGEDVDYLKRNSQLHES